MEYQLLDSGNLRKLEQAGPYRLIRPALTAFWTPTLPASEWERADAVYTRNSSGSGKWDCRRPLPESWTAEYAGFQLKLKPTGFGHLGFFAEQYRNWEFFRREAHVHQALNLFAYSAVGSLALAAGGAKVCHLDAARGMIEWGRENAALNPEIPDAIRWIADDVQKFVKREIRRGTRYDLIALDPPTFGRGAAGQLWKIETDLPALLEKCRELRDPDRDFHIVLSSHSPGFSLRVMERLLSACFGPKCRFDSVEMTIPERSGEELPAGGSVRCLLPRN